MLVVFLITTACLKAQDSTNTAADEFFLEEENVKDSSSLGRSDSSSLNSNSDNASFKPNKGPSKFKHIIEQFHFNAISGVGITRWRSREFLYNDTTTVRYKGTGLNIPAHLQILYDFGRVRFGVGGEFELYRMRYLRPAKYEDVLPDYKLKGLGTVKKFYGHLGYEYFKNRMYTYIADVEVGMFKSSPAFNNVGQGFKPYINLGVTLERKYSELFRVFLKPSIEIKGQQYKITPEFGTKNRLLTYYALCGISYSIPMTKKCPIKTCGIRVHHYHKNSLFRGNPFHRLQNPDYGEEDRKFIKERGKKKWRVDPY